MLIIDIFVFYDHLLHGTKYETKYVRSPAATKSAAISSESDKCTSVVSGKCGSTCASDKYGSASISKKYNSTSI